MPANIPLHPTICQPLDEFESLATSRIAFIGLLPDLLPIIISLIIIGIPIANMQSK